MTLELAEQFRDRLWRFVRRRVAADADADDVVQDVLLRLWQHRDDVADATAPAWLFQVARNAIADLHRKGARAPQGLADGFDAPERVPEPQRQLAACLEPLLAALPDDDRALLLRIDQRDGTQIDLARELGLSPSGAKSRVQRARARLRQLVDDCCRIELDRRGLPTDDFAPRRRDCGDDGGCGCR